MKLHNTLSRTIEEFKPQKDNKVSLYTCGPTVYNYYHIGNLRNAVFNDTLRRTLEASGFNVKHVMNITDVGHLVSDDDEGEDKLETGAKREGKTVWEVAQHYTDAFKRDMQAMNVLPPNSYTSPKYNDPYVRATEFIDQQIAMIKLLVEKDFAYVTRQAIYFDVTKLADYGLLSGQRLADKEVGVRSDVITDDQKKNPHDFAIWFFAVERFANHSMQWDSPWGKGFPGWHLECSAIIHATLGDPVDIHTGGVDHIGTHHPNEMAQTEAAFGHPLAHYWIHNEFILVDGAKMSKSKGNSYTLKDVIGKGFDPLALRLLYLQAHYRKELNFSWESLEAATSALKNFSQWADLQFQSFKSNALTENYTEAKQEFVSEMSNDLGTPGALAILNVMVNRVDELGVDSQAVADAVKIVDSYFGLNLSKRSDITDDQKALISDRQKARDEKDFSKSDELRETLNQQGVGVRDTDQDQAWYRL